MRGSDAVCKGRARRRVGLSAIFVYNFFMTTLVRVFLPLVLLSAGCVQTIANPVCQRDSR